MENTQQIHQALFDHLYAIHQKDPKFLFTLRNTNRYGKLDKGYWFYGNDHYVAVSFWNGMDWRNKTPNIIFVITEGHCYLEISVSDSDTKRAFIKNKLLPQLPLEKHGHRFYKEYKVSRPTENNNFLTALDIFLNGDKKIIDSVIESRKNSEFNEILFITPEYFWKQVTRILTFREVLAKASLQPGVRETSTPLYLESIHIRNVFGIRECTIDDIPPTNRCIFLTGENGTGKSSILKAIGASLINDHTPLMRDDPGIYSVTGMVIDEGEEKAILFEAEDAFTPRDELTLAYAAYGPLRLNTGGSYDLGSKGSASASLFSFEAGLIDIEEGLRKWRQSGLPISTINERLKIMTEVIEEIVPRFKNVQWGHEADGEWNDTVYQFEDDEEGVTTVSFQEISSGARAVLAMIGDMMIRLFHSQPQAEDIADLKGIVLIDEIDLHLHPIYQKMLVQQLVNTFERIQFIITTHSPLPLLGAPEESVFFIVKRKHKTKTYLERLNNIDVRTLTPNTILTSPIFAMHNMLHWDMVDKKDYKNLRTEATYDEMQVNDRELQSLISKYKQRKAKSDDKLR